MQNLSGDIILGGLMTRPPLPTLAGSAWKVGEGRQSTLADLPPEKIADYLRPLYESVHRINGLRCVVIHDGLKPAFTERYTTERFTFEQVTADGSINAYDRRFFAFRDWLELHPEVSRVFITDVNDVAFVTDPFAWWNSLRIAPDIILLGEEWTKFRENDWWTGSLDWMPDDYQDFFTREFADKYPLTCGTFAARRDSMLSLLGAFTREITRVLSKWQNELPPVPADMQAFNVTAYRHFLPSIAAFKMDAGYPGVKLLAPISPLQHDRGAALKLLDEARIRDGMGDVVFRVGTEDRLIWDCVAVKNEYRLPDDLTGQSILDIGGHIGSFAHACLTRGAKHVLSVEPDKSNFDTLQKNTAKFGTRAAAIRAASWRSDEGHESDRLSHTGYGTNTGGGHCRPDLGAEPVPIVAFDTLVRMAASHTGFVDLLKLDCEGGEWPSLFTSRELWRVNKIAGEYHGLTAVWLGQEINGYTLDNHGLKQLLTDAGFSEIEVTEPDTDGNKCGLFFAHR
jgi:FkbM family methyltransferase